MSGSGSGHLRLGKHVGTFGRPVVAITSCEHPGPIRLGRHVGTWPAFWTGGGSGSGTYVPARPVIAVGECITNAVIPYPCCPGEMLPGWLDVLPLQYFPPEFP